ncbi:uncharacterized protein [Onthophagus taurus]|uniref:uncharacterized protein n=1 Tax=Onthophagus taurus TaxID=166361 RepID=UPI000C204EB7|nr:uncharacterized protein LOC111419491 [Onthophagus taurus]
MSKSYSVVSLTILVIVTLAYNHIEAADKRCHKVPLLKNFDVDKVTGNWYGQEIGDMDGDESSRRCLAYSAFTDKKKSNATFTVIRLFNGTTTVGKAEMYQVHQINDTSEFESKWKQDVGKRSSWTIGTDYDTWSTWYVCQPEQDDRGILFITTREKYPNAATLEAARNSARNAGFKMSKPYLKRVDHSHCFN